MRKPVDTPFATTAEGLRELEAAARELLPGLDTSRIIRSFAAVRPNPYRENGEDLHDFCIENPAPGFYSLIGIKTPGLTCADQLGQYLAEQTAAYLQAEPNPNFTPTEQPFPKRTIRRLSVSVKALPGLKFWKPSIEGLPRWMASNAGWAAEWDAVRAANAALPLSVFWRKPAMEHFDILIIGGGAAGIAAAIADGKYTFISRGDASGTHTKELSLRPEALGITKEPESFVN